MYLNSRTVFVCEHKAYVSKYFIFFFSPLTLVFFQPSYRRTKHFFSPSTTAINSEKNHSHSSSTCMKTLKKKEKALNDGVPTETHVDKSRGRNLIKPPCGRLVLHAVSRRQDARRAIKALPFALHNGTDQSHGQL